MKVLFDHQVFSYQTYGGISRYFFELMNQFQEHGDSNFQLALKYSDNVYLKSLQREHIHALPVFGPGSKSRFLVTYLLNKRFSNGSLRRGDFDVFHPTFFDDYFLSTLGAKPFVLTLMDMTPERYPELFQRNSMYGRMVTSRWIDGKRKLADRATRIIAISENTKQDVVRFYGIDPERIKVIYLASSLLPNRSMNHDAIITQRPYILFVGSRFGYKNFEIFSKAMCPLLKRAADLQVICTGGGPFSEDERRSLASIGILDRFQQTDVSDEELAMLYGNARAFVFPSRYEGFGIPIVEAFSCGCPCVLSRTSCFPEIARDAAAYFDPDDVDAATEAIGRVLNEEVYRDILINRGSERAKHFSWRETARQTIAVYKEAVAASA